MWAGRGDDFDEHDMTAKQLEMQTIDMEHVEDDRQSRGEMIPPRAPSRRARIAAAIRAKQVQVRLWSDGDGRIYRVQVISSTGDAELDASIRDDVLGSLMFEPDESQPMTTTGFSGRGPVEKHSNQFNASSDE
jgi:hypothetical protein